MTKERLADLLFVVWQKERVPESPSCRLEDAPKHMRKSWEAIAKAAIDVFPMVAAAPAAAAPAERSAKVAVIPAGDGWKPTK